MLTHVFWYPIDIKYHPENCSITYTNQESHRLSLTNNYHYTSLQLNPTPFIPKAYQSQSKRFR